MLRSIAALACVFATQLPAADAPPAISLVLSKPDAKWVIAATVDPDRAARLRETPPAAAEWRNLFPVIVAEGSPEEIAAQLPIAGTYSIEGAAIRFEPGFALVPGVKYRATLHHAKLPGGEANAPSLTKDLAIPKPAPGPRVSVAAVYPSANQLPENALRFYIQFTQPVARGGVYRHLKLIRGDGEEVKEPFLELEEELWSPDGTRLTLLFHPGRVKHNLLIREEEGPILEAGHRYTLIVDSRWNDLDGRPLVNTFRKEFAATQADTEAINPDQWPLVAPLPGTTNPVIIRLAKPLDHALLGRLIGIEDEHGDPVQGDLTVGGGERVVTFSPKSPWKRGEYRLAVDRRLEDACGNRVGESFEIDVSKPPRAEGEVFRRTLR